MNPVEIEEAVSKLAEQPFDAETFPFVFLEAFGNKPTTIQRLRTGSSNKSDIEGGVLQYNNIHIAVSAEGKVHEVLAQLRSSPATSKQKAKFILSTDGTDFQAEELLSGETVVCEFNNFANYFGFFLPLAGISTVKQIKDSSFDIKATGRLNRLYIELLKDNPKWGTKERRPDMNHFMARLIFCFFAEDTEIFSDDDLFTGTIERMSAKDSSNTHEVIAEIFRAMNTRLEARTNAKLPRWTDAFPYVNGGLFSGSTEVPRISKIARSYLIHIGSLDWQKINPDIFGSMIQAISEDEERGALGMHYTSVPNILKVLNPLFLDELRAQLKAAGDNKRALLNLRKRISNIRVFDPACGSGNFLVIAYKELREIEAQINKRRGETDARTEIELTNFRGIELRDFPAEIARLALIIAEYQCDVLYRGQKEALLEFLPLEAKNWITNGNALRVDWLKVCPLPTKVETSGETFICGNPPYKGSNWRTDEQTSELGELISEKVKNWKALDYVTGWILKAAEYAKSHGDTKTAFVTTNSICQGQQASVLWPIIFRFGIHISFAHSAFKWANLASHNAGVSVIIIGLSTEDGDSKRIYEVNESGESIVREVSQINAYLLNAKNIFVEPAKSPLSFDARMTDGSGALDGGHLILDTEEKKLITSIEDGRFARFVRSYLGSSEFIRGNLRFCLWIEDDDLSFAAQCKEIKTRIEAVRRFRESAGTRARTAIGRPHKFAWINKEQGRQIIIPTVFSEQRDFVTAGFIDEDCIISNAASIIQSAGLHVFSIVSSKVHMCWVKAIAGRLKTDIRYTSSTCYNNFPMPHLTEKNIADLTRCAEDILLAREAHFPASIAELYEPNSMPEALKRAHDRNDEVLERVYIGRRFKNDSERLEKLFELYTKMTATSLKSEPDTKKHRKNKKSADKKEASA